METNDLHFQFTVKTEIPDSPHITQHRSLPVTPKSVNDNQSNTGSDTFSATVDSDNMEEDKIEYEYNDFDASEEREQFVLAPTPAQLGQAPLQRRLGSKAVSFSENSKFIIMI